MEQKLWFGLTVPTGFPATDYDDIHRTLADFARATFRDGPSSIPSDSPFSDAWRQFEASWRGVAFRFKAMAESEQELVQNLLQGTSGPKSVLQEYDQDKNLAHWLFDGYSALESLWYSIEAIGALLEPAKFPDFSDSVQRRTIGLSDLAGKLEKSDWDLLHKLAEKGGKTAKRLDFENFSELRRVLTHRSNPGKTSWFDQTGTIVESGFRPRHFLWEPGGKIPAPHNISIKFVDSVREWLTSIVTGLLGETKSYVNHKLQSPPTPAAPSPSRSSTPARQAA